MCLWQYYALHMFLFVFSSAQRDKEKIKGGRSMTLMKCSGLVDAGTCKQGQLNSVRGLQHTQVSL